MRMKVMSAISAICVCSFLPGAAAFAAESGEQGSAFQWFSLVKPLGVATLSVVGLTFLTGLFRRKLRGRFLKIHLPLAAAAVTLGVAHGLLVFILYR